MVIFDSRSYEEYHSNSIPGAISVPGAELVYRFQELVPSPDTFVVVNCGGRTRSIIGAQALIDAGVPNRVVSLKDGTMAWHLAGLGVVAGATGRAPEVSAEGVAAARRAGRSRRQPLRRAGDRSRDAGGMAARGRSSHPLCSGCPRSRSNIAPAICRSRHDPGRQLVQETDSWLGVWGARVVLVDDTGVRARMTASGYSAWVGTRSCWIRAWGRARRRRAGAGYAGGSYRHLPARRPRAQRPSKPSGVAGKSGPLWSIWR